MNRNFDATVAKYAQTHRTFSPIEGERPLVQTMESQKFQGDFADFAASRLLGAKCGQLVTILVGVSHDSIFRIFTRKISLPAA
jgi:hypothetical protein